MQSFLRNYILTRASGRSSGRRDCQHPCAEWDTRCSSDSGPPCRDLRQLRPLCSRPNGLPCAARCPPKHRTRHPRAFRLPCRPFPCAHSCSRPSSAVALQLRLHGAPGRVAASCAGSYSTRLFRLRQERAPHHTKSADVTDPSRPGQDHRELPGDRCEPGHRSELPSRRP